MYKPGEPVDKREDRVSEEEDRAPQNILLAHFPNSQSVPLGVMWLKLIISNPWCAGMAAHQQTIRLIHLSAFANTLVLAIDGNIVQTRKSREVDD